MNSTLSRSIIKHFLDQNILCFGLQDVLKAFPGKHPRYLAGILTEMVRGRMLCRFGQNQYHIIPPLDNPEAYIPDGPQLLRHFMKGRRYYFGYSSALRIHGLTGRYVPGKRDYGSVEAETGHLGTMHPGTSLPGIMEPGAGEPGSGECWKVASDEFVVVDKQVAKSIRKFGASTYQFIRHTNTRFFGFERMFVGQAEEAMVSDLEKTIVDIATRPFYSGGIVEVGNAIIQVHRLTDHEKLFFYFVQNESKSAMKRFLYLSDLLELEWKGNGEMMLRELGSGVSLLDPVSPRQGKTNPVYKLKMNLDPVHLKKTILQRAYPGRYSK